MFERIDARAEAICRALEAICGLVLMVMTVIIAMLVTTRNFLGFSYPWSEELTRYLLVWLSLLGAAVLTKRDDHIRFEFLADRMPRVPLALLSIVLRVLVLGFLWILLQQSWAVANARASTHSPALGLSMMVPYLAIPVSAALMLLATLLNIWGDLRRLVRG